MKVSEYREKSIESLKSDLVEFKREQFNLRMQITSGQSNNTARLNSVRKDIARIKTLLNEKRSTEEASK